jgi:hypothetical protein
VRFVLLFFSIHLGIAVMAHFWLASPVADFHDVLWPVMSHQASLVSEPDVDKRGGVLRASAACLFSGPPRFIYVCARVLTSLQLLHQRWSARRLCIPSSKDSRPGTQRVPPFVPWHPPGQICAPPALETHVCTQGAYEPDLLAIRELRFADSSRKRLGTSVRVL